MSRFAMLDPAEFGLDYDLGDMESANPAGGPGGLTQPEIPNDPDALPRMWAVTDIVALAQNAVQTVTAASRPDFWIVALDGTANTGVNVYQGSGAGGEVVKLGPKGRACIPAQSTQYSLTVLGTGATAANVTVVGVRGWPCRPYLIREG